MSLLRRVTPLQLQHTFRSLPCAAKYQSVAHLHISQKALQKPAILAHGDMSERPTGLKATKGIELLTWGTPNGVKASIILEELKEAYGKVRLSWFRHDG